MKVRRVLLAACLNCTRMHLSCGGNLYPQRLFSSFTTVSSRFGGTRPLVPCGSRAVVCPLTYTLPPGNGKLYSRSYSDAVSNALCSQTLLVSKCQPGKSAVTKKKLLHGGATWPGKNELVTDMLMIWWSGDLRSPFSWFVACLSD